MIAEHSEELDAGSDGFESLSIDELCRLFEATPEQVEALKGRGLPMNADGTFRFVAVLAFVERSIGEFHGAR